jgi:Zn-finger nucleic acid-binding protein
MDIYTWRGVTVDICQVCHGIWFDFKEMADVDAAGTLDEIDDAFKGTYQEKAVEESMKAPRRHCPRDGTELNRHEWFNDSKIMMDYCPTCSGVFLDAGELEGYVGLSEAILNNPPKLCESVLRALEQERQAREQELRDYQNIAQDYINPFKVVNQAFSRMNSAS